jgi:hypothetical protein
LDKVWAKVLKGLRESGYNSLFALAMSIDDISFTNFNIILNVNNNVEFNILEKNSKLFQKLAGGDFILLVPKKKDDTIDNEFVGILQNLFGDRLKVC